MTADQLYQFCGIEGLTETGEPRWVWPPGTYRFVAMCCDYRTGQEKVCYQGVGGLDDGKYFIACTSDWIRDFSPAA